MDSVKVALGYRSYPVFIGSDILKDLGLTLRKYTESKKVALVTNPTVSALYLEIVKCSLEKAGIECNVIEIPDGEEYKSLESAGKIFDKLISFGLDRYSPLIALGGGVVGDIAGFAAATYLRGVPLIQLPTTLLAQVDSSVGGKTAVNHRMGKNLIGAFYQPMFVYIDVATLKTLDVREIKAGLAEVVKYGVIKDEVLFKYLEDRISDILALETDALTHIIRRSCEIKAGVVGADEKESGQRAILNFGHTYGHAVETLTKYKRYKHGEAVAMGMVFAAELSGRKGLCSKEDINRIVRLLDAAGLPVTSPEIDTEDCIQIMMHDKKVIDEKMRFVLLEKIGRVKIDIINKDDPHMEAQLRDIS